MVQNEGKILAPGQSLCSGPPPASSQPTPSGPFLPAFFFFCLLTAHQSSRAPKLTFCREQPASENHFFLKNLTKEFY